MGGNVIHFSLLPRRTVPGVKIRRALDELPLEDQIRAVEQETENLLREALECYRLEAEAMVE